MTNKKIKEMCDDYSSFRKLNDKQRETLKLDLIEKERNTNAKYIKGQCFYCLSRLATIESDYKKELEYLYLSAEQGSIESAEYILDAYCNLSLSKNEIRTRKYKPRAYSFASYTITDLGNIDIVNLRFLHNLTLKDKIKNSVKMIKNPMELLKYEGNEAMNVLIVLAYLALTFEGNKDKAINYLCDFALAYYMEVHLSVTSDGLYNDYGFYYCSLQYAIGDYEKVDPNLEGFVDDCNRFSILKATKNLYHLLKERKGDNDKTAFAYAIFKLGSICKEAPLNNDEQANVAMIENLAYQGNEYAKKYMEYVRCLYYEDLNDPEIKDKIATTMNILNDKYPSGSEVETYKRLIKKLPI